MSSRVTFRLATILPAVALLAGGGIVIQQEARLSFLRRDLVRAKTENRQLCQALGVHSDPDVLTCHDPSHHHAE